MSIGVLVIDLEKSVFQLRDVNNTVNLAVPRDNRVHVKPYYRCTSTVCTRILQRSIIQFSNQLKCVAQPPAEYFSDRRLHPDSDVRVGNYQLVELIDVQLIAD